jgi:hypothetical protein
VGADIRGIGSRHAAQIVTVVPPRRYQ